MKFHVNGSSPQNGEIFVFGSNLGGQHIGGAAKAAHKFYGAEWYVGVGHTGNSYAIPTVNETVSNTLQLVVIKPYIKQFIEYAKLRSDLEFFVTGIGTSIAGYKHSDIAPLFRGAPDNCSFPDEWQEYLVNPS